MRAIGIYYAYWTSQWAADFVSFVKKVKDLGFDQLVVHGGAVAETSTENRRRLKDEADTHGITLSTGLV